MERTKLVEELAGEIWRTYGNTGTLQIVAAEAILARLDSLGLEIVEKVLAAKPKWSTLTVTEALKEPETTHVPLGWEG